MIEGEFPLEIDKPANHFGLIYDGIGKGDLGYGVKKLSYYAYKKMFALLEGSDWGNTATIQERGGIYIYKFIRQGKSIWVAWNENAQPRRVVITLDKDVKTVIITDSVPKYELGKHIANYAAAFNPKTKSVTKKGVLTLTLGKSPLFVEEEKEQIFSSANPS